MTTPTPTSTPPPIIYAGLDFESCMRDLGIPMRLANRFDEDARDNVEAYVSASAENTRAAFRTDVVRWIAWCERNEVDALAPRPRAVRQFIREHEHGRRPNTLKRMVANIGVLVNDLAGNANITRTKVVKAEMKRVRRESGGGEKQALAIRLKGDLADLDEPALPFSIERMIPALVPYQTLAGARARFTLSLCGDTGRRFEDYHRADIANVRRLSDGAGLFIIGRSKTDQAGEGMVKSLSPRTMRLFDEWLAARRNAGEKIVQTSPLLIGVDRWGNPMSRLQQRGFNIMLREWVGRALKILSADHPELSAEVIAEIVAAISSHSFRVGSVEDFTAAGESIVAICIEGGWKTPSMPIRYGRNISARNGAAARLRRRFGDG